MLNPSPRFLYKRVKPTDGEKLINLAEKGNYMAGLYTDGNELLGSLLIRDGFL